MVEFRCAFAGKDIGDVAGQNAGLGQGRRIGRPPEVEESGVTGEDKGGEEGQQNEEGECQVGVELAFGRWA